MGALFDDVAFAHDEDEVCVADGGQPVGDDEACASLHQVIHRLLDQDFCPCVYGAGRLVEDQDLRIGENSPCDRQELLLPLGDVACLLIEFHIVAARQSLDKAVYMRRLGCPDDFFICGVKPSVTDILHDRAVEQPGILEHHAEHLAQFTAVEIFYIVSVDLDGAAVDIVETHQQLDHGRLPRSGRTHDRNLLPFLHLGGEIIDDDLIRIVTEVYMVELHISLKPFHRNRIRHCLVFLCLIEKLEHSLRCSRCGLKHICHLRHLLDRLGKVSHILDKGLDITDLDRFFDRQVSSEDRHRDISEVPDELHHRHHHSGEKLRFPRRIIQLVVCRIELPDHVFLFVECLNDIVAAVNLLHLAVYISKVFLLSAEISLRMLHHKRQEQDRDRQDQDRHQRHQRADGEHHDQYADDRRD